MSIPRFAGWGAVGGLLLSAGFVSVVALAEGPSFLWNVVGLGPIFAIAGAGCAGGSLAIARRAEGGKLRDPGSSWLPNPDGGERRVARASENSNG